MVSCREAWQQAKVRLQAAGVQDAAADANLLLELAAGPNWRWRDEELCEQEQVLFNSALEKREQRVPIQYIVGRWPFLDLELEVGPGVLVPRADTEIVCEAAANLIKPLAQPAILDLCAGSGALGLGLKRLFPGADVTGVEKSPEAFFYLKRNCARALPLENGSPAVKAVLGDVFGFEQGLLPAGLDLIVSNPPYLTGSEMQQLQPEVAHEPAMALAAGEDGLDFYRYICTAYKKAVKPGGWLCFEIGWQQRCAVSDLLLQNGWAHVGSCRDLGGNDRAVWGQKI